MPETLHFAVIKSIESGKELIEAMEMNKTLDIDETVVGNRDNDYNNAAIEMDVETDLDNNNNSNNKLGERLRRRKVVF